MSDGAVEGGRWFIYAARVDEHGCQWFVGDSLLEVTCRLNGFWGLSWSDCDGTTTEMVKKIVLNSLFRAYVTSTGALNLEFSRAASDTEYKYPRVQLLGPF